MTHALQLFYRNDPEGGLVRSEFLPLQDKTFDAGGAVTQQFYDTLGRNVSMIDRNTGIWLYIHDHADNIIRQTAPDGKLIENTYDALNRILIKSYPTNATGDTSVVYEYDTATIANGKGRLTRVTDASGATVFGYDVKGNISSWVKTMPSITGIGAISVAFSAQYDQQKRITKLIYPDGSAVSQYYTDAGYLRQVRLLSPGGFFGSPIVTYEGPDLDQKFIRKTGNGVVEKIGYDPATHRPTSLETVLPQTGSGSGVTIRHHTYSYDGNGNTLAITDLMPGAAKTETFVYDGLNRVTSATGAYGTQTYAHDARGRLVTKDNQSQLFNDIAHPEAVSQGVEGPYGYDANGNLIQRLGRQYVYDTENRLKEIKLAGITKQSFAYDFSGTRAVKTRDDGAKIYYFGGLKNYGALYEIAIAPGATVPQHTKYIYGLNSDRAAQVTVPNANLVAYGINTQQTLALLHGGSTLGNLTSLYHSTSAYLMVASNVSRDLRVIFYILAIGVLGIYLYRITVKGRLPSTVLREHQNRLAFHTAPWMLIVFVFFYGVGCGSSPTTNNDPLPVSGNTATAAQIGDPGGDNTTKGFPASGTFFFHPNHVGSLNYITNTVGAIVSEYNYLPYGQLDIAHSSGPDIARYKFATYERDAETGLDNANARMYMVQEAPWSREPWMAAATNSESGSFASPDTIIPGDGERSQGYNRYMYTEGNPVRYNDPTGHDPEFIPANCKRGSLTAEGNEGGCLSTVPWWHNYTGPTHKGDKNLVHENDNHSTVQDWISMQHDMIGGGAQFFTIGTTQDRRLLTIVLDAGYIALSKLIAMATPVHNLINVGLAFQFIFNGIQSQNKYPNQYLGWAIAGAIIGAIPLAFFFTATDVIVGQMATVLFTANIAFTATQYLGTAVGLNKPTSNFLSGAAAGFVTCGFICAVGGGVAAIWDDIF